MLMFSLLNCYWISWPDTRGTWNFFFCKVEEEVLPTVVGDESAKGFLDLRKKFLWYPGIVQVLFTLSFNVSLIGTSSLKS